MRTEEFRNALAFQEGLLVGCPWQSPLGLLGDPTLTLAPAPHSPATGLPTEPLEGPPLVDPRRCGRLGVGVSSPSLKAHEGFIV